MSAARHTCPVCGFAELDEPTVDLTGEPTYAICPCCGTQFGADDLTTSHAELRAAWIKDGARWWSEVKAAPQGWNALAQLAAAGHPTTTPPSTVPSG